MQKFTTEMMLSVAVIILRVLAIVVFIVSGAGFAFYGLFVIAVVVMAYTWYRISGTAPFSERQGAAPMAPPAGTASRRQARGKKGRGRR